MANGPFVIVYAVGPIDHWQGWIDLRKFNAADFAGEYGDPARFAKQVEDFIKAAKAVAYNVGWEGDIRQGPFLSALPIEGGSDSGMMVGWKQDNNGTTFIASSIPLEYMSADGADFATSG